MVCFYKAYKVLSNTSLRAVEGGAGYEWLFFMGGQGTQILRGTGGHVPRAFLKLYGMTAAPHCRNLRQNREVLEKSVTVRRRYEIVLS